jgi:hypothetical protein
MGTQRAVTRNAAQRGRSRARARGLRRPERGRVAPPGVSPICPKVTRKIGDPGYASRHQLRFARPAAMRRSISIASLTRAHTCHPSRSPRSSIRPAHRVASYTARSPCRGSADWQRAKCRNRRSRARTCMPPRSSLPIPAQRRSAEREHDQQHGALQGCAAAACAIIAKLAAAIRASMSCRIAFVASL